MGWLDASTHTTVAHFDEWKQQMRALHEPAQAKTTPIRSAALGPYAISTRSSFSPAIPTCCLPLRIWRPGTRMARRELESYVARADAIRRRSSSLPRSRSTPASRSAATLERLLYIYPEDEELHRRFGSVCCWIQNETDAAIRQYQAVLAMKPLDAADAHYQLARAYRAANRMDAARDEVLLALEAAPDYKPAQKLLLEITR